MIRPLNIDVVKALNKRFYSPKLLDWEYGYYVRNLALRDAL